jgi:hypothetical protein
MEDSRNEKYATIRTLYKEVVDETDKDLVQHLDKSWFFDKLEIKLAKANIKDCSRRTVYRALRSNRLKPFNGIHRCNKA